VCGGVYGVLVGEECVRSIVIHGGEEEGNAADVGFQKGCLMNVVSKVGCQQRSISQSR
jgi:hypothetical protein